MAQDIDEQEIDELDTDEELDEEQDQEDEPDSPDDTDDDDADEPAGSDDDKPGSQAERNAWRNLADRVGDRLRGKSAKPDDDGKGDADGEDGSERTDEDPELSKGEGDDSQAGKGDAKEGAAADAPVFEIVDENGDKFALELPEGAKIVFAGDGKQQKLDLPDVIKLAQKGVAFDRALSMAGQERSQLRGTITQMEADREADEELLLKLVFDELEPEKLDELRETLEKYRDPEFREGQQAIAERKADKERSEREAADRAEAQGQEFWAATDKEISSALPEFEFVTEDDSQVIKDRFHAVYQHRLKEVAEDYTKRAPELGLSKQDALDAAQREAAKILTEKMLRTVMADLDEHYAKRLGRKPNPTGKQNGKLDREASAKREVDEHNRRTEQRRSSARDPRNRSLRGGGAAPSSRDAPRSGKSEPATFEGKIGRALARLRSAGRDDD